MSRTRCELGLGLAVATVAVLVAGCSSASSLGGSPTDSPKAGEPLDSPAAASISALADGRTIVLADGSDGIAGLWALDANSAWTQLGATPGATALGPAADGIALASGSSVEVRPASALGSAGQVKTLKWPGAVPMAPIVALDSSAGGKMVLVTAGAQGVGYAVAAPDGTIAPVDPAPAQSFTPSAAWLDDSRLLVLATDKAQASRLAVADTGAKTLELSGAVSSVRVMGVSGDRQTVCLATESAVWVGSVDSLLGTQPADPTLTLTDGQVVWGLALDANGSHLYMFSGTAASDGTVAGVHELGYVKRGSDWVQVLDSAVPFGRAIGQVFLA
jgi:hypothetical protein